MRFDPRCSRGMPLLLSRVLGSGCCVVGAAGAGGLEDVRTGAGNAGADRADTDVGDLGGFFVGVAQHLGEDEGLAALGGQLVDQDAHVNPL